MNERKKDEETKWILKINGFQIKCSGLLQFFTTSRERNRQWSLKCKTGDCPEHLFTEMTAVCREGLHF